MCAYIYVVLQTQLEKRKQEDELKKVMQQEQHLERIKVSHLQFQIEMYFTPFSILATNYKVGAKFKIYATFSSHHVYKYF